MTRALFWISLVTSTAIGAFHAFIGLASFEPLSPSLVWFIGAGFAVLLHALVNLMRWRAPRSDRLVNRLTHGANVLMAGFGFIAIRAVPETRAYVAFCALLGLLVAGFAADRDSKDAPLTDQPRDN